MNNSKINFTIFLVAFYIGIISLCLITICCSSDKLSLPKDDDNPPSSNSIYGVWKVKSLNISGELIDIQTPNDALFPNILITIPEVTQGYIDGSTFYNVIEIKFKIKEYQQIRIYNVQGFLENNLIIQLKQGIDVYEFAANCSQGIVPIYNFLEGRELFWVFETDGTKSLNEIMCNLSQNPNVMQVRKRYVNLTRFIEKSFAENMRNTVKFNLSNKELKFMDAQDNLVIVFINHSNKN